MIIISSMEQKKSFKKFIYSKREYLILTGIVFLVIMTTFAISGAFPFGDGVCLVSDSGTQIGPFFEYLMKVVSGEASLFYSPYIGGGVELFATIEYMLFSPFYLICFLGGKSHCLQMFNIAFILMMLFNAIVFVWFSKKYFKDLNLFYRTIVGLLFVFSGYTIQAYSFLTWEIFPALLLLLVDAFMRLVNEKKILRFILILVWYVVNCFSIGVFSNFILVILFVFYIMFKVPAENKKQVSTRLFVAYVIGAIASFAILYPQIFASSQINRMTDYASNLKSYSVFRIINLGSLFVDGALLLFAIIQIIKVFKTEKCSNNFKFLICTFSLLLFPYLLDISLQLISGGRYVGFSMRYYFIFNAFLSILTMQYFENPIKLEQSETQGVFKMIFILMTTLIIIAIAVMEIYFYNSIGTWMKNAIKNETSAVVFYLCLFVAYVILFAFVWGFNKRKVIGEKLVKITTILILIMSSLLNILTIGPNCCGDIESENKVFKITSEKGLTGNLKVYESTSFAYIDIINRYDGELSSQMFFSSYLPTKISSAYDELNCYSGLTVFSAAGLTGNMLLDIMIGNKYVYSETELNRPYLTLIDSNDESYLYENTLVSTGAFLMDNEIKFDCEMEKSIDRYNQFAKDLGVSKNPFESINPDSSSIIDEESSEDLSKFVEYEIAQYTFTAPADGFLYVSNCSTEYTYDMTYENMFAIGDIESNCELTYLISGETYTLTTIITEKSDETSFYFLNYDAVVEFSEIIKQNECEIKKNKTGWEVSGTSTGEKTLVVFMNDIDGYSFELNGESIKTTNKFLAFTTFDVCAGEILLSANYSVPYLKFWIIISVICVLLIVALALLYRFTKFRHIEKICHKFMMILMISFVSIFYGLSIILSVLKIWL